VELCQPGDVALQHRLNLGHCLRVDIPFFCQILQELGLLHQVFARGEFGRQGDVAGGLLTLDVSNGLLEGHSDLGGDGFVQIAAFYQGSEGAGVPLQQFAGKVGVLEGLEPGAAQVEPALAEIM
jgi:hypothetical protein